MRKKLIMTCMAASAFAAFVVTPTASAATLTETGVAVPVGASITGTAGEIRFIAGSNTVACSSADASGTVTANANGTVAGEIAAGNPSFTGTATGGDCTSGGLGPVKGSINSKFCLHVPKGTDIGTVTGCAGAVVTFSLNVTNLGLNCRYEKAEVGAEITTAPADAQVKIRKGEIAVGEAGNSPFCPANGELEWEFTLTTTGGTTLTFS